MKKMTSAWHPSARSFAMHSQPLLFWAMKAKTKAKIKAKNEASNTQKPGPNAATNTDSMIRWI